MLIHRVVRGITESSPRLQIRTEKPVAGLMRTAQPARMLPQAATSSIAVGLLVLGSFACSGADLAAPAFDAPAHPSPEQQALVSASLLSTAGKPFAIAFNTYDGSGEVVHPDVVSFSAPWNGHRFWNALTPYPNSAIQFENPSLYASEDGDSWTVPAGALNPLATTARGYLSDPDMVYEPISNQLWLYYREVENRAEKASGKPVHTADHVWLTTSSDGAVWSLPKRILSDAGKFVVSPSVVRLSENRWSMYAIDAGPNGCSAKSTRILLRTSQDGVTWNAPGPVQFVQPGYLPWHLDVQYIESRHEYWALVAAYRASKGCTTTSLFLATSQDGRSWTTYPSPVMAPGEMPQFATAVYRSTFAFAANDSVTIWFSGARTARPAARKKPGVLEWSAAVSHTTAAAVIRRVTAKPGTVQLSVSPSGGSISAPSSSVP